MKLTKQQLKQLIKEELQSVLNEQALQKWPVPQNWIAVDRKKQPYLDKIKSIPWYKEGQLLYSKPDRSGHELQIMARAGAGGKKQTALCDVSWDSTLFKISNFCVEVKT
jgi:hypothetical protein